MPAARPPATKHVLDPQLWKHLQAEGFHIAKPKKGRASEHESPKPEVVAKPVPPSLKEMIGRMPQSLSVRVTQFQTSKLLLRTQKERSGVWTVGYRRAQTVKNSPVSKYYIKELTWTDAHLMNALAKAWLGLRSRGTREVL